MYINKRKRYLILFCIFIPVKIIYSNSIYLFWHFKDTFTITGLYSWDHSNWNFVESKNSENLMHYFAFFVIIFFENYICKYKFCSICKKSLQTWFQIFFSWYNILLIALHYSENNERQYCQNSDFILETKFLKTDYINFIIYIYIWLLFLLFLCIFLYHICLCTLYISFHILKFIAYHSLCICMLFVNKNVLNSYMLGKQPAVRNWIR